METADTITDLYRQSTAGDDPDPAYVQQLLDALDPGEEVLFACGWPDNGEKWGPVAQLTVTSRRIPRPAHARRGRALYDQRARH